MHFIRGLSYAKPEYAAFKDIDPTDMRLGYIKIAAEGTLFGSGVQAGVFANDKEQGIQAKYSSLVGGGVSISYGRER